jgi:hypothetical protein
MKRVLFAVMAVAVAVSFSAPSFAGEEKKVQKDEKKGGNVVVFGDETKDKKDEKKPGQMDAEGTKEGREGQGSTSPLRVSGFTKKVFDRGLVDLFCFAEGRIDPF